MTHWFLSDKHDPAWHSSDDAPSSRTPAISALHSRSANDLHKVGPSFTPFKRRIYSTETELEKHGFTLFRFSSSAMELPKVPVGELGRVKAESIVIA